MQQRVQEYRKNNPELNKLSREKAKLAILKKKVEDPKYHEEQKKKEKRKIKESSTKKAKKIASTK